jgi:hypothetical protein
MTYLAFDPQRVAALARAMNRSMGELRGVRNDDPAAADLMRQLRALTGELETTWLPLARRTAESTALIADLHGLRDSSSFVMVHTYGWSIMRDPLVGPATITAAEARALGARLNGVDATSLADDPGELRWLSSELNSIARDPVLAREFLANFQEWAPWLDALGRHRARIVAGTAARVTVGDLDGVFASLAHVQRAVIADRSDAHVSGLPWIGEANPYGAALVVRHLGLSGRALGLTVDRILRPNPLVDVDWLNGPNAADLLLPLFGDDTVAIDQFLRFAALHPDVLFERTADTSTAFEFVLQATDPSRMSADVAREVVPLLVEHLSRVGGPCDEQCHDAIPSDDWRGFLVDLISPWMLQFSPQNTQWRLHNAQREEMLSFVLRDEAALQSFVANADRVRAGFLTSLSSGTPHALDELGAFMAMIGELIVNERMMEAGDRARALGLLTDLAGLLTSAIPGIALAAGISMGLLVINSTSTPDPVAEARRAGFGADLASTAAGAAVAEQIANQWKRDGSLPADHPMPPIAEPDAELPSQDFLIAFGEWRIGLPGGEFGALADEVTRHVYSVINPGMMGAHSVTLFTP